MKPPGISDDHWFSVMEGLALGRYSLILGAGASVGATNSKGAELPTAQELARLLRQKYSLPQDGRLNLRQTYDLCMSVAQRDALDPPGTYLKDFFHGCTAPEWYKDLVRVPWQTIWTLNIDNVLEDAYNRLKDIACQTLDSRSWRDPWTLTASPEQVTAVHLHGNASGSDLIFGTLEYLGVDNVGGAAHRVFRDQWQGGGPRVVVGASLEDEFDIAAPLSTLSDDMNEYPSICIRPSFSETELLQLDIQGLLPIAMKSEDFFAAVASEWSTTLRHAQQIAPSEYKGISPTQMAFLRDFSTPSTKTARTHDFFAGDEPEWSDILRNFDAPRILNQLSVHPSDIFPERGLRVIAFHGNLSGATTAELRFLKQCQDAGYKYLEHRGETSIQANVIHGMAKKGFRKILRVPDLPDFPDALGRLKAVCDKSGLPVVLVCSVRTHRVRGLAAIVGASLTSVSVPDQLSPDEIDSVIDTLRDNNRSNLLAAMSRDEMRRFIYKQHRGDLIDSLSAISRGRAFEDRYALALEEVTHSAPLAALRAVLICGELGFELPTGVAARVSGLTPAEFGLHLRSDVLAPLLTLGRGGIRARHRGLASRASQRAFTREERFITMRELARALAPHITPATISIRSRESRLCGALMSARQVVETLGVERAADWYEELEPEYSWNARFWEQRALSELRATAPRFERAEAWAREALTRHRDPFSLNTTATVLLRRATTAFDEDLLFEGLEYADEARRALGERQDEHPYITALSYLAKARRLAQDYPDLAKRLDWHFHSWRRLAEDSALWSVPEARESLASAIGDYLIAGTTT